MTPSSSTPSVAMGQQVTGQHLPERGSCSRNTRNSSKSSTTDPLKGISKTQEKSKKNKSSSTSTSTAKTHSVAPAKTKPVFNDNDDFYILHHTGRTSPDQGLTEKTIKKLKTDVPGIFNGLDVPDDLLFSNPEKYQPLAKLVHEYHRNWPTCERPTNNTDWYTKEMTYEQYKGGFYSIHETDYDRNQMICDHYDHFRLYKESNFFISQLCDYLFDQSVSNDNKIINLQTLFLQVKQDKSTINFDELSKNMNQLKASPGFCSSPKKC